MQKKLKLAVLALCYSPLAFAQNTETSGTVAKGMDESAFTFTEAQLGEDDDMSDNVTIMNSNSNVYASEVGYLFSPVRFRYRALNQKYNDVYINGVLVNDMESGQFRYSLVGGLNQQTRNVDYSLPFEGNNFSMSGAAGSNNYNFRAGSMPSGHRITLSGANRNYTVRAMYTYASGFNKRGWAVAANLTYRWAKEGYVEGTFYNALSYFLGVQKKWDNGHSLSLSTWGNPTERASQGASTDEAYWMANDRYYNPYWGYQNGHKRNSRVVNDFAPSAIATWDWDINSSTKLTTSLFGKYSMYKSTKLNYNNSENPHPDYWKAMPSSYYDIWDETDTRYRTPQALEDWNTAYDAWTSSKENRQINWDRLYYSNIQASKEGQDALYYIQAKHIDNITAMLSSTLTKNFGNNKVWNAGIMLGENIGKHYQTMEDLLGATTFHNLNTYAVGTYPASDPRVQYDLNTMHADGTAKFVGEGDKFGYDYDLIARKGNLWTSYSETLGRLHYTIAGKIGYDDMQRKGRMRNGLFAENSFGKSDRAKFLSGGAKFSGNLSLGKGHTVLLGLGYENRAPQITTAFVSPEMNNDFVTNLHNERLFTSEIGYQYKGSWLNANINAYYNRVTNATEWQNFYFDDENAFTYVSMTNIKKVYMGIEAGVKVKLTSFLDFRALGTYSDAKYLNNSDVRYLISTAAEYKTDIVRNKGMRESGTPLTATSLGLSYHQKGWFIDVNGNWYDRIYLSYSPCMRYEETLTTAGNIDNEGNFIIPDQSMGHGGWMLDVSIGKSIYLKRGSLSINLMITNALNNQSIVTGGYEQSRSPYTTAADGSISNVRAYKFPYNPKKYYAFGTNGMLNIAYKF